MHGKVKQMSRAPEAKQKLVAGLCLPQRLCCIKIRRDGCIFSAPLTAHDILLITTIPNVLHMLWSTSFMQSWNEPRYTSLLNIIRLLFRFLTFVINVDMPQRNADLISWGTYNNLVLYKRLAEELRNLKLWIKQCSMYWCTQCHC